MRKLAILILVICGGCASEDGGVDFFGPGDGAAGVVGIAGSTSRFIIKNNYLYIATDDRLKVLDLSSEDKSAEEVASLPTLGDLETIFAFGNNLFIGAESGVYLYDITNPASPEFLSRYEHQTACDPVIANQGFAYLTIRGGTDCRGENVNRLITLNIADVENPEAVDTLDMISPRGLAFYENQLFVGEGIFGLKRFDLTVPYAPVLDTFYTNVPANDMIALPQHLIVTQSQGIHQYGVAADSLNLLSVLK